MHKEVGGVIRYVTLNVKLKQTSYKLQQLDAFEYISSFVCINKVKREYRAKHIFAKIKEIISLLIFSLNQNYFIQNVQGFQI